MAEQSRQKFELHKIYVKDLSFESPMSPGVFRSGSVSPTIDIQIDTSHQALGDDIYESVLRVTVRGKFGDKDAFLVEVQQAGIYEIAGVEPDKGLVAALEVSCPNMLFPFAREAISDVVVRGGFPQLLLSPVNFEYLYKQKKQSEAQAGREGRPQDNGDGHAKPGSADG